jgi:outer membrane biosynthesis protein TonB
MGFSYNEDEGPIMCFNGPKNWQLGWYADRHVTLNSGDSWFGNIYGLSNYTATSNDDAIVIKIAASPDDIYVSYNRATGINAGTVEGINQVLVHTKVAGESSYGESKLVAKLSQGGSASINGNEISFTATNSNFAMVQIGDTEPPTPSPTVAPSKTPTPPVPTSAPTSVPTPAPTVNTPDPTHSPTLAPTPTPTVVTPVPTSAPTSDPTPAPTVNTPAPTHSPTLAPTITPTTSPTLAPTNNPTTISRSPTICEDDVEWQFAIIKRRRKRTNGRNKITCEWISEKKRKQLCNKLPGAIEHCPLTCNACTKTGSHICESLNLKKTTCMATSCCEWKKRQGCRSQVGDGQCF